MCIIFMCNKNRPSQAILEQAATEEEDGIGIAWQEGALIRWEKGLDLEGLKGVLKKVKSACGIHFRDASIGGKSQALTHPFPINEGADLDLKGTAEKVLMHNGTWQEWRKALLFSAYGNGEKLPLYPIGDTRALAWLLHRNGVGLLDVLDLNDRFLIMDATTKNLFRMWGSWVQKDGFMQSKELVVKKKKEKGGGEDRYANYPFRQVTEKVTHLLPPAGTVTTTVSNVFSEESLVAVMGELRASQRKGIHPRTGTC